MKLVTYITTFLMIILTFGLVTVHMTFSDGTKFDYIGLLERFGERAE